MDDYGLLRDGHILTISIREDMVNWLRRARNEVWFFCSIYTKVSEDKTIYDLSIQSFEVILWAFELQIVYYGTLTEAAIAKGLKFHVERDKVAIKQFSSAWPSISLKQNEFRNIFAYSKLNTITPSSNNVSSYCFWGWGNLEENIKSPMNVDNIPSLMT